MRSWRCRLAFSFSISVWQKAVHGGAIRTHRGFCFSPRAVISYLWREGGEEGSTARESQRVRMKTLQINQTYEHAVVSASAQSCSRVVHAGSVRVQSSPLVRLRSSATTALRAAPRASENALL